MLSFIMLQAEASQGGGGWSSLIMIGLLIVIFYFFMIRPQSQRQKKIQEERNKLTRGDKVITQGGIIGRVKDVRDDSFIVEIAEGVKITVDKNCIYAYADAESAKEVQNSEKQ